MTFDSDDLLRESVEDEVDAIIAAREAMWKIGISRCLSRFVRLIIFVVALGLLALSIFVEENTFLQLVLIELGSGCCFFVALPSALKWSREKSCRAEIFLLAASIVAGVWAAFCKGVLQHILLELATGLLLLVGLELVLKTQVLKVLDEVQVETLNRFREEIKSNHYVEYLQWKRNKQHDDDS